MDASMGREIQAGLYLAALLIAGVCFVAWAACMGLVWLIWG